VRVFFYACDLWSARFTGKKRALIVSAANMFTGGFYQYTGIFRIGEVLNIHLRLRLVIRFVNLNVG
jgi:hypothetical protein